MITKVCLVLTIWLMCSCATNPPSTEIVDANAGPQFEVVQDSTGDMEVAVAEFYDIRSVGLFVDSTNIHVQVRTSGARGYTGSDTGYFIEFDTDFDNDIDWMISLIMNPVGDQSLVMASTGTTFSLKRNACFKLKYHEDSKGFDVVMCKTFLQLERPGFQWRVSSEVSTSYGLWNDFLPNQDKKQSIWLRYDEKGE